MYADTIFNILMPDNDHLWSNHVASLLIEYMLISSVIPVSSVVCLSVSCDSYIAHSILHRKLRVCTSAFERK
jgi:hypothetical protein